MEAESRQSLLWAGSQQKHCSLCLSTAETDTTTYCLCHMFGSKPVMITRLLFHSSECSAQVSQKPVCSAHHEEGPMVISGNDFNPSCMTPGLIHLSSWQSKETLKRGVSKWFLWGGEGVVHHMIRRWQNTVTDFQLNSTKRKWLQPL